MSFRHSNRRTREKMFGHVSQGFITYFTLPLTDMISSHSLDDKYEAHAGHELPFTIMAIKRLRSLCCCCTHFHICLSYVTGKCHVKRQVIYIFDQMILHFLFVFEIKDFFNHCGWWGT